MAHYFMKNTSLEDGVYRALTTEQPAFYTLPSNRECHSEGALGVSGLILTIISMSFPRAPFLPNGSHTRKRQKFMPKMPPDSAA